MARQRHKAAAGPGRSHRAQPSLQKVKRSPRTPETARDRNRLPAPSGRRPDNPNHKNSDNPLISRSGARTHACRVDTRVDASSASANHQPDDRPQTGSSDRQRGTKQSKKRAAATPAGSSSRLSDRQPSRQPKWISRPTRRKPSPRSIAARFTRSTRPILYNSHMPFVLSLDEGTTSARAALYDEQGRNIGMESAPITCRYPQPGWVEQDALEIWRAQLESARRLLERMRVAAARDRRHRHHQPARDHRRLGPRAPASLSLPPSSGSAAAPPTSARELAALRRRRRDHRARPAWSSTPISPPARSAGFSTTCPDARAARARWRTALRQHRHLADLEAHQRRGPRHRSLQRLPHHAHEPGDRRLGRRSAAHLRRAARHAAAHRAFERRGRRYGGGAPRARASRSPASRAISRRRWPARPASAPAFPRTPTAPAVSRCCTPADACRSRGTGCWRRARRRRMAQPQFAIEGSVFIAGAAVQWLRDQLGVIRTAAESEALATSVPDNGGVYFVPAFVGLGAPHWDAGARGLITGITRSTGRAHIVRAALESIAYQTRELVEAMEADAGEPHQRAARGWRRRRQQFPDAVPGRHSGPPHRAARGCRDHRAGRRVSGRPGHRLLEERRRRWKASGAPSAASSRKCPNPPAAPSWTAGRRR